MKRVLSDKELPNSATKYVLESLVPYTDANLKLNTRPVLFFNDLENISRQKAWLKKKGLKRPEFERQTLRNAFYNAKKKGLISIDDEEVPRLTDRGRQAVQPYKPQKLGPSAYLMVAFDIPETQRHKRRHLRLLLKELSFVKVQQSIWVSRYDHREYLKAEIKFLDLRNNVQIYECNRLM